MCLVYQVVRSIVYTSLRIAGKIMFRLRFFFFFSHLCPLLLLCINIYVSPMVALLGSQQEGSGSNSPWLGPFGVEFACSLGGCVVLSMSTLGQIVVQHFV